VKKDFWIRKGDKIKVYLNNHSFQRGQKPDVRVMFITSDDAPRLLSKCKTLLVGQHMKEYYSITPDQVIVNSYQPTLF